jgi:hypothetical protein
MRFRRITVICILLGMCAFAQEKAPQTEPPASQSVDAAAAEARSRKFWQDFKKRDKAALAATLAEGFRVLEEGANFTDAKGYLAGLDDFALKSYELSDYVVTELGRDAVLINYHARYEGVSGGETSQGNAGFSEVWVRRGGSWKIQYLQETYVK